jgi:hypothetical protein
MERITYERENVTSNDEMSPTNLPPRFGRFHTQKLVSPKHLRPG